MKTNKIFRNLFKLNNQAFINSSVTPLMEYNI
jgi:hypothetical protein